MAREVPPSEALQSYRADGVLFNAMTGAGDPNYDRTTHSQPAIALRLTQRQQEELFHDRVVQNICTAFPSRATKRWTDLSVAADKKDKGRDPDEDAALLRDFRAYESRLQIKDAFRKADTWANIYGGSGLLCVTDDPDPISEPLNPDRIRSLLALEPLDRYDLIPDWRLGDVQHPSHYWVIMAPGAAQRIQHIVETEAVKSKGGRLIGMGTRVHASRIIRFDGVEMPPRIMERNGGWGQSLIDAIWQAVSRFESAYGGAEEIVQTASILIRKIKGFSQLIVDKKETDLSAIFRAQNLGYSIYRTLFIDSEDEASFTNRQFSSLSDVLDRFKEYLVAVSGMSHTFIFGESPSGLGATGDSEAKTDASKVIEYQESYYRPRLLSPGRASGSLGVYDMILAAKDGPTKGKPLDSLMIKFPSILDPDGSDEAGIRSQDQTTYSGYVGAGILLKEEVRDSLFGESKGSYPSPIVLQPDLWKKQQEQAEQEAAGAPPDGMPPEEGTPGSDEGFDAAEMDEDLDAVMAANTGEGEPEGEPEEDASDTDVGDELDAILAANTREGDPEEDTSAVDDELSRLLGLDKESKEDSSRSDFLGSPESRGLIKKKIVNAEGDNQTVWVRKGEQDPKGRDLKGQAQQAQAQQVEEPASTPNSKTETSPSPEAPKGGISSALAKATTTSAKINIANGAIKALTGSDLGGVGSIVASTSLRDAANRTALLAAKTALRTVGVDPVATEAAYSAGQAIVQDVRKQLKDQKERPHSEEVAREGELPHQAGEGLVNMANNLGQATIASLRSTGGKKALAELSGAAVTVGARAAIVGTLGAVGVAASLPALPVAIAGGIAAAGVGALAKYALKRRMGVADSIRSLYEKVRSIPR